MLRTCYRKRKLIVTIILINASCIVFLMGLTVSRVFWDESRGEKEWIVKMPQENVGVRGSQKVTSDGRGFKKRTSGGRGFQKGASDGRGFQKVTSDGRGFKKRTSDGRGFQKVTSDGRGFKKRTSVGRGFQKMASNGVGFQKGLSRGQRFQKVPTGGRRFQEVKRGGRGFQNVTNDGGLYAYSAYFDARDEPQLRVFVMCAHVYMNVSYTCRIRTKPGEIHDVLGEFSLFETYRPYKYKYVSGVIKCPLDACCQDPSQLESVSLDPVREDLVMFHEYIPIPLHKLTTLKHKLTILFPGKSQPNVMTRCFAALHHNYDKPHKLIWSIEISRLLGADKFIFYNYSISPVVNKVLRHYMKEGLVEVRVWDIPETDTIYYFGQMIATHDCLMSQTFSAKYVLLADLDEIFLTRKGLSLVNLADKVFDYNEDFPQSNLGSLAIRCLSFIKGLNKKVKQKMGAYELGVAKRLQIEPLLYTTYFTPYADNRKALVIPDRIDRMCVHNACFLREGYEERTLNRSDEAVMLHYRDEPRHLDKNATLLQGFYMLKYAVQIVSAIAKRTKIINF